MASLLEQLLSGEVKEEEIQKKVKKIKDDMAARSIALSTFQAEQRTDKVELSFLVKVLEEFGRNKRNKARSQYIRKSIHTIDEVLSMAGQGRITTKEGHIINTDSMRYQLFKEKGVTCVDCGLEGKFFAKEKDKKEKKEIYHFNLYGIRDGKEVLFTRDHIKPRCKGGQDVMENLQTMCITCNCRKGSEWEENKD